MNNGRDQFVILKIKKKLKQWLKIFDVKQARVSLDSTLVQDFRACLECDANFSLFECLASSFWYYSWVLLHFLVLFISSVVLFS